MAKTLTETPITTRSARSGLAEGTYWRGLDPDVHIGYRKAKRGGRWLVRWYAGNQKYNQATLGTADDVIAEGTLSFEAASRIARDTVAAARARDRVSAAGPVMTIEGALLSYIGLRDARQTTRAGRTVRSDASHRLSRHVLTDQEFVKVELHRLTERDLKAWSGRLDSSLASSSRQRLINDLKAALNSAYAEDRAKFPAEFVSIVKYGLKGGAIVEGESKPVARTNQILTDEEVRRIVEIARATDEDGDFGRLVLLLAATGARFSQLRRLEVGDVQIEHSRLLVPKSWKGKARVAGHTAVRIGSDVIDALRPVLIGRAADAPLLERWRLEQITATAWKRVDRGPWKTASEMLRPWRRAVDAAGCPGAIPYALRHSSIVRGIRLGLPIRLVAASHDTSVAMIERHYSRWITDGLEELSARAVIPLL